MKNLSKATKIKELYLTGNPCENWEDWREYVIASVPQLLIINGVEILKSERIKASQKFEFLEKELKTASIENIIRKENDPDKDNPNKYSKEYRRKLYKELEEEKIKKEEDKKISDKTWSYMDDFSSKEPSIYKDNGEIRICNQGKYDFYLDEDIFSTGICTFELKLPKFLDTSNIQVDLNPQYVRVNAKGKITQLKFSNEIIVEKSSIQRSQTTGYLLIKAPISGITPKTTAGANNKEKQSNISREDNKIKKLKLLEESIDFKKGNKIEIVSNMESNLKPIQIKNEICDINLDEIPDLD